MKLNVISLFVVFHFSAGNGQSCTEGEVRLQSRSFSQSEGTVHVCINEVWGTICSNGWDSREAGVVCGQLGLPSLGAIPRLYAAFGRGSGPVWLDNVRCLGNETRILNCTHNGIAMVSSYCSHSYDVGVQCPGLVTSQCSDGDIRLAGGATTHEGRVEVCYQNSWGTVCDDVWSSTAARVVCRQLNFSTIGASPYSNSFYGRGSGGIYLDDVFCSGNEQALINCSHRGMGVHGCTHSDDAGVMCSGAPDNCTNGEVRLVSGRINLEGTVQVCVFGYWGTICHNSWDSRDAYVACKQLGYPTIGSVPLRYAPFGHGMGPIWLDNVQCLGNESLVINCSHRGLGVTSTYCDHSDDVGVQCVANNFAACTDGQLRLVGGSSENEGRVEICYKNQWGTICNNGWSSEDAKVVCRQLGFQTLGAVHFVYGSSFFGRGSDGILLQNLACSGDELMLINCSHSGLGVHSCSHSQDAGVVCLEAASDNCTAGQVRLVYGSNRMEGTVQICTHGYWGTVCDTSSSWDSRSADIVCSQLGYTTYTAIPLRHWRTSTALDKLPIWLDSIHCNGNESSLLNCTHSAIGEIGTSCSHYYDVGVRCLEPVTSSTPCTNGTVRLVGGSTSYEGRVEMCYRNQWGTVCSDFWSTTDAQVVCRQLGLNTAGAVAYSSAYYGQGYGAIFLDNVACSGTETMLIDCISSSNIGIHNCQHYADAGVKCQGTHLSNCTHGDIRLESGRFEREGTLRVCIGGIWSTVCNSGWDSRDAAVVCQQLAFPVSAAIPLLTTRSGRGTGTALVGHFACTGQELSLLGCRYTRITSCSYTSFAGVQCLDPVNATTPCYDGEVRLTGGTVANEGRVELCYQNQWGTVCRDGWSVVDARVACRQLGYSALGAIIKRFEGGDGAVFLESLGCSGVESTLIECSHPPITVHNCDHSDDAGVLCNLPVECTDGDAVLLFGPNPNEGTVEVCTSGYWSTVCSSNWDSREASIVCRQLGLPSLGAIPIFSSTNTYGSNADRPIILSGFQCTGSEKTLLNCPRYGINSVTCSHGNDVGVQCPEIMNAMCATGEVRLADGRSKNTGRVEICYQGQWGTVCDDGWSSTDARVVCNQLGYSPFGAAVLSRSDYRTGSGPVFLDDVGCQGTESSILECSHPGIGVHNCQHDDDVEVGCLAQDNCTHGVVRLLFGSNEMEGTVEVCINGYWGTICDNGWDSRDAGVICRQLGYSSFGALPYLNSYFGSSSGPILLDFVSCNLSESTIINCTHNGFGITSSYCDHNDDAGVQCLGVESTEPCTTGDVRLVGSTFMGGSLVQGRVEICYQNVWGTICHHNWKDLDARVVCRILGYPPLGGVAYTSSRFGNGMGVIFLDNVACRGNETSLLDCSHSGIGVHTCDHTNDAGVACNPPSNCTEHDVRLTGDRSTNPREGTVEICLNGYWGTICRNGWDSSDARVICSTLGFPSLGAIPYRYSYFGYGTGPVILDSVNCTGNESIITQCAHLGIGVAASYCYHYYDVGVQCPESINSTTPCSDGDVRLTGGLLENQGRVEICYQNQWGTVCHDLWDNFDAGVVCRQLGYSTLGAISYSNSRFGNRKGPILLDNLQCKGSESTLLECTHPGVGVHDCNHAQDAGVECATSGSCTQGDLRLRFGFNEREGTVEVCVSGYWSSICDTFWDSINADVVCRQAGFISIGAVPYTNAFFGRASGSLLLDNVQCRGSEDNVLNCSRNPVGVLHSSCDHGDDVGVQCPVLVNATPPCSNGDLRLVGGSSAYEGRVEICYQNMWGTICDDSWDVLEARVVCSQLRYPSLGATVLYNSVVGSGSGPIFLDNVGCTGSESTLLNCVHTGIGIHNCKHTDDVGVRCQVPDNCTLGDIRLLFGSNDREGTVEICAYGYWSTICHNSWDSRDAAVVCRQLGFTYTLGAISHRSSFFGRGDSVVILDSIGCIGTETKLIDCAAGTSIPSYCSLHHYDAGVTCIEPDNSTMCTDGAIRLIGGVTTREGRVEICYQNQWGSVCDNGWGVSDSQVVCRELGFHVTGAIPYSNSQPYGTGSGPIFLENLQCVGNEANLLSCGHSGFGVHHCSHHEDAGVNCSVPSNCTNGDVRLRNGLNTMEGNVEVCIDGFWGTVCSNSWDSREASVVCKQLGYLNSAAIPLRYGHFGVGSGPILLDYLQCTGSESNLFDCSHSSTRITCNHYHAAGVECADHINATVPCADGDLRLVGGMNETEGRVEICISNQWGTICHNSWSISDAKVVCRQFGFSTLGAVALTSAYFGRGSGGIFLDQVRCAGAESSLISCLSSGIGVHTCDHSQDAGVQCQVPMNCSERNIRLRFGVHETTGTVEVCAAGFWGTICHNLWDSRDADVVCRQLGFPTFGAIPYFNSYFGSGSGPILLDRVSCNRQETNILECAHGGIGVVSSSCNRYHHVGVQCIDPVSAMTSCTNGAIRLVGGSNSSEGRVEICYQNYWGTICDHSWSYNDAQVTCSQLGYSRYSATAYSNAHFGQGSGGIFLSNVLCTGTENSLFDCPHAGIGVHNCRHLDDAGVSCSQGDNCTEGEIRLHFGSQQNQGTVAVCVNSFWSSICHRSWDSSDAQVVCKQLGYTMLGAAPRYSSYYGRLKGPVLLGSLGCIGSEANILQCSHRGIGVVSSYCNNHYYDAGVDCPAHTNTTCTTGSVRLVNGSMEREGRVEVCYQNQWGTVCDYGWGSSDARVVCRQLGFESLGGVHYGSAFYGSGTGGIFLSYVPCRGNEQFLLNCTNQQISAHHTCTHSRDAGVNCTRVKNCTRGSTRLIHGLTAREGTVEICVSGFWGTVCDNGWDSRDAQVICHQLGLAIIGPIPVYNSRFGQTADPILVDFSSCIGNETNLLNCSHNNAILSSSCDSNNEAGVICAASEYSNCTDGGIRLIGTVENEGRVEICYHNQWGTICDNRWDDFDAQVVCNQLGYPRLGGISVTNAFFGQGSGGIFLNNVRCNGNEQHVINCSHDGIGVHTCRHNEDAGLRCLYRDNCTRGSVRLRFGQTARRGTVEVCVDGYWGTICHYGWDSRDADVVCRQLGFNTFGAIPRSNSYFGRGNGPVVLNSVSCYGNESNILDCHHFAINSFCSTYSYDSGVECVEPINATTPCMNGDIHLIGGLNQGRVEVCYGNQWGSVCDDSWDNTDARVACRQLGFPPFGGTAFRLNLDTAPGAFFLDDLHCRGNETTLLNCTHNGIAVHSCISSEVAGIICQAPSNCSSGDVRLNQGSQGTVEICVNGYWGTVCDNQWDSIDASVVCRQLGYSYFGSIAYRQSRFGLRQLNRPILLDRVSCNGNEQTLLNCTHSGHGVVSPYCNTYVLSGVQCQAVGNGTCYNGQIRLVDGASANEGRVEFCYQNQWGTVCDDSWSNVDAQVVCRQLGYSVVGATAFSRSHFGSGTGGILLDNVGCSGQEHYLVDCNHSPIGVHNCDHSKDSGVFCVPPLIQVEHTTTVHSARTKLTTTSVNILASTFLNTIQGSTTSSPTSPVSGESAFFQLRLQPVSDCVTWTDSLQEDKQKSIIDGVFAAIESLCSCSLPDDTIDSAVFSCRNTNTAIVFKARINIANNRMSADQILMLISRWVKTSPSIVVLRTLLQLDPTCPTELEALLADDCQKPLIHSNVPTVSPSHPDTEKHGNDVSGIIPIIGTAVGVLVVAIIIVIIITGCVVLYKAKRTNTLENWTPRNQLELSEYTREDIKLGVSVARNPAYMPFDFDLDHKPSSKVFEDDHEYDFIPATFTSHQHDGPAHPTCTPKKDGVPQNSFPPAPSSLYETPKDW